MVDHAFGNQQRAITERLLLGALHEQDMARLALEDGARGRFLAGLSRDLGQSLEEKATRAAVARCTLPREDSWSVVDIVELDGTVRRLPPARATPTEHVEGTDEGDDLDVHRTIVVPLEVRASMLGAITFVTDEHAPPFSPEERALAFDIAELCALALDNARLYRQSEVHREIAEVANRAKSTFLSMMSHELMTPLNAIGGYVTLMEMGLHGPVTLQQKTDLARIRLNQSHLTALFSQILAHAKSEAGHLQYRFSEVSVSSIVADVIVMLQASADARQCTVTQVGAPNHEVIWADADRVRQILLNLVMNAVKYGKSPGGAITIETSATADKVQIHVIDDGAGIPPHEVVGIFAPFVQLQNELTNRRGGVGLGLAISRDLARAMKGDLTVSSTVGVGSRFTLELPKPRIE